MAVRGRIPKCENPVKLNVDSMLQLAKNQNLIDCYKLDIIALIKSQNIELVYDEDMPSDVSGVLKKENDTWTIHVNKMHSQNRQRYTIAHEFGHYCLHKDYTNEFKDKTFFRKEKDWTSIEYDANQFAAELLMSKECIKNALNNDIITIKELSEAFGVSMIAMRNRLLSLNYKLVGDE